MGEVPQEVIEEAGGLIIGEQEGKEKRETSSGTDLKGTVSRGGGTKGRMSTQGN